MNELYEKTQGFPAMRTVSQTKDALVLDEPVNKVFSATGEKIKIVATNRTITKIKLEREISDGVFIIVKQWFANRQPEEFEALEGTFRITANRAGSKIIINGGR